MKSIRSTMILPADVLKSFCIVVVVYFIWLHLYVGHKYKQQKLNDLTLLTELYKQETVLDKKIDTIKQFLKVESSTSLLTIQNQRKHLEEENNSMELFNNDAEPQPPSDGEQQEQEEKAKVIGEESLPLFRKVHRNRDGSSDNVVEAENADNNNAEDNADADPDSDVFNSATVLLPHLSRFIPTLDNIGSRYPTLTALKFAINRADTEIKALDNDSNSDANGNGNTTTMEAWQDLAIIFDEQYEMLQSINFYDVLSSCPTTNDSDNDDDNDEQQQHQKPPPDEDIKHLKEHAKQLEQEIIILMEYYHDSINDDDDENDDWPVVLDDTNDRIDKILTRTIDSAKSNTRTSIQQYYNVKEENDNNNDSEDNSKDSDDSESEDDSSDDEHEQQQQECIESSSQLLPWIDASIDAINRKTDIRQSILNAIKDDESISSTIILDDVTMLSTNYNVPTTSDEDSSRIKIPLRQFLDTPLTKQATVWIDQLVDATSGRSDTIDHFWDSVYSKHATKDGRLGPSIMEKFMNKIGGYHM